MDGVTVENLDAQGRRQFNIPNNLRGALVTEVDPTSSAATAGIRPGDVILEINRQPVSNADEAVELGGRSKSERVLLRIWSNGGSRYVVVESSKRR